MSEQAEWDNREGGTEKGAKLTKWKESFFIVGNNEKLNPSGFFSKGVVVDRQDNREQKL